MSTPQTGRVAVPNSFRRVPLSVSFRRLASALRVGASRTPELTVGATAVILSAAFSSVPSLWYDEGATVTSATRSWAELWAEIHRVDAVHALYYACMHVWFWLVGYTPFTLRFPSAIAIGVSAALVVALGRRIGGRRLGIVSGIVFAFLPRALWAGGEGRPYATITTLSIGLTLVGMAAVRRTRRLDRGTSWRTSTAWWIAYAALAVVAVTFNVYLALVVVAHGIALVWTALAWRAESRRVAGSAAATTTPLVTMRAARRWIVAAVVAAVIVLPVVLAVVTQSRQVSWIQPLQPRTPTLVFAAAWFGGSEMFATVAWALLILGAVLALHAVRRARPDVRDIVRAQAVRIALPIVVAPTAILLGATAVGVHLYSPKYASMSLPFVAILIGLALTAIRPRVSLVVALATLAAIAIPTTVDVKLPYSKQNTHWPEAAALIERQRALHPGADDGVIYGSVNKHGSTSAQIIRDSYPRAFAGLTDLSTVATGAETGRLWDTNGPIATTVPSRLGGIDTVWFLGGTMGTDLRPEATATLEAEGFHVADRWRTGDVVIVEYLRAAR